MPILRLKDVEKMKDYEVIEVTDVSDARIAVYSSLTDAALRSRVATSNGLFIAESPKVIEVALRAGYVPESVLCERRHIKGDARRLLEMCPEGTKVYTGSREVLSGLTGYPLTRGVLCAMHRPAALTAAEGCCSRTRRVAVIDGVCDATNIGSIFRAAAALGMDGVLLTPGSCDPLNRRSVRVSMGTVFVIPWAWLDGGISSLHEYGYKTVALALRDDSVSIDDAVLRAERRLALVLGTEGDGLSQTVIEGADYVARIPMHRGVDSLNVAGAASVAFWELRARD